MLLTLVVLVIMASLAYTITSTVATFRHRSRFIIDHTIAMHARDSAIRLATQFANDIELTLISRPNEPDFSDLFHMSDDQVEKAVAPFLTSWAQADQDQLTQALPEALLIRGPYGPAWPQVTEPVELEIGPAHVTIQFEDENAKYPVLWLLMQDQSLARSIQAGFATLCEWMDLSTAQIEQIREQLAQIAKLKRYSPPAPTAAQQRPAARQAAQPGPTRPDIRSISPTERNILDIIRLLHSPILDHQLLARPTIEGQQRIESLAKYIGLWGTEQVNINTAPRHVLEATFAFVGDAAAIADAVIQQRRLKPFTDLADLRKRLTSYADALEKCSRFITFASNTMSIKVKVQCGSARSQAVLGVTKGAAGVRILGLVRS
ncbi:MAG: type II secretion system protein GspK [Sedimentisphaerales bacterium]|nr:type II secretion system protein GspK [Sedimentisphaerales bacterium]